MNPDRFPPSGQSCTRHARQPCIQSTSSKAQQRHAIAKYLQTEEKNKTVIL